MQESRLVGPEGRRVFLQPKKYLDEFFKGDLGSTAYVRLT
jgi:hypothetical protein